jgi:hypothetical protein
MNKYVFKCLLTALLFLLISAGISAQRNYVKVQPMHDVIANRSPSPGQNSVYVINNWKWSTGGYTWSGGYWVSPPYYGARWIPGRWINSRFGWYWINGYWSRRR